MRAKLLDMDSNENDDSKADFEEYRPVTPESSHNGQSQTGGYTLFQSSFKEHIYVCVCVYVKCVFLSLSHTSLSLRGFRE